MQLNAIKQLFHKLNDAGVRYCHWKSNFALDEALSGIGDLDLLIAPECEEAFRNIVFAQDFKEANDTVGSHLEGVTHYFGLDEETGRSVHLHTYTQIYTGETLTKNYQFPIAELLLENRTTLYDVQIPTPSAEMVVFTLRMLAKHGSLLEMALLFRDRKNITRERKFLIPNVDLLQSAKLAAQAMDPIDEAFFLECMKTLKSDAPVFKKIIRGFELSRKIKTYRRASLIELFVERHATLTRRLWMRTRKLRGTKTLHSGGKIIAFLGPEATGKSTLVHETSRWLGKAFQTQSAHLGKPPSTPLTILPNQFLPLGRRLFSSARKPQSSSSSPQEASGSLVYAIRSVLLAWDRLALAKNLNSEARNGSIIICDRYPSADIGSMDSARLDPNLIKSSGKLKTKAFQILGKLENSIYNKIPKPDTVIKLTVPLDIALERNQSRNKNEPIEWVKRRHQEVAVATFDGVTCTELDTGGTLEDTIIKAKQLVWSVL